MSHNCSFAQHPSFNTCLIKQQHTINVHLLARVPEVVIQLSFRKLVLGAFHCQLHSLSQIGRCHDPAVLADVLTDDDDDETESAGEVSRRSVWKGNG